MLTRDLFGQARIEFNCIGGCLTFLKILYSCSKRLAPNARQLALVRKLCDKREKCILQVSRDFFGFDECENTPENKMWLWFTYRCDGKGAKDRSKIIRANKTETGEHRIFAGESEAKACDSQDEGQAKTEHINCGKTLKIRCKGGCLTISRALYSCGEVMTSSPEQLEKFRRSCEGNEQCNVKAGREIFEADVECKDEEKSLLLEYR